MKDIEKFEDLKIWQDARKLTNQFYELTRSASFEDDQGIGEVLRWEAGRIMAKLAEGIGARDTRGYVPFIREARRLASGLQSYLYLALDHKCITDEEFKKFYDQLDHLKKEMQDFKGLLSNPKFQNIRKTSDTLSRSDLYNKLED